MTTFEILSLLILVSAACHIYSEHRGHRRFVYVFKPLTLLLILAMAALQDLPVSDFYRKMVIVALCFSLLGDIFLMLPADRFLAGLASFLVAHIVYVLTFWQDAMREPFGFAAIGLVLVMVPFYVLLNPNLGNLRLPVAVYICVIAVMVWAALSRWFAVGSGSAAMAASGAVLFMISDSVLAFNRFRRPFRAARSITMVTYFSAQWLLAGSIARAGLFNF